ncbi:MAG TPA: S8 family serine peptidase [Xanthomonadales bacterium]
MRALRRLFLTTLIGLTGLGAAQADLKLVDYTFKAANIPAAAAKSDVYIVQMRDNPAIAYTGDISGYKATKPEKGKKLNPNSSSVKKYVSYLDSKHDRVLGAVGGGVKIYSYHYALNGFAAVLTSGQAEALRSRDDVVQVWRDEIRQPTTDSTPDYLGLTGEGGVWDLQGKGEDIIVGIVDTGIWPEHPSFSDQNDFSHATGSSGKRNLAYGPPPASWSGSCQSGEQFSQDNCNNKVIGARYYPDGFSAHGHSGLQVSEYLSPRDSDGHGSHTASTAAGNEGPINNINGKAVSGMAPRARIAVYKVCWEPRVGDGGCASSDSAAAIDQAVADGVDVINFSIGGPSTRFSGPDDIAFLFAAAAGVFVATSNGNAGPGAQTTGTPAGAPWITAVGASQDDQVFALNLVVTGDLNDSYFAREGAGDVPFTSDISNDMVVADPLNGCAPLTNDIGGQTALVIRGVCSFSDKYNNAAAAGATAIIVYNDGTTSDRMDPIVMSAPGTTIPGAMIGFADGDLIHSTVAGGGSVTGTIGPSTTVSQDNRIADFSSRGPNGGAPDVIKPDVAAPGVGIIAAGGPTPYISISGTSMASPHVAGIFALLKEAHPDWSAAMAKSAVMTSARQDLLKTLGPDAADPFDIGAGAIVPAGSFSPGLVYDAGFFDYLAFSCDNNVQLVSDSFCALLESVGFPTDGSDLNLASIGVADLIGTQTVTRTVTSVSPDGTTFTASVDAPAGIDVVVTPDAFTLNEGESQTFTIDFTVNGAPGGEWAFGGLTWNNDSGQSPARSPIAVKPALFAATSEVDAIGTDGSVDIDVQFGYTGDYTAVLNGLEESAHISNSISSGLQAYCADLPAHTHLRFSTFDADTTPTGADLDLRLFYADDGCDGSNQLMLVGSSGGATSEEIVDVVNPAAGGYFFVIDYYASSTGSIDYTAWVQPVFGDNLNANVSAAPASAVTGATGTVTVDYAGLDAGTRYLGVVQHEDGVGEMSRTIIDIDTQ